MFPQDELELPVIKENDADDTHYRDIFDPSMKGLRYYRELMKSYPSKEAGLKAFTQAYLACVTAVDECIGQVIDAVDNSSLKGNTIIVVTSDHGWNMGEKDYIFKNSPWEESCRIPFIIRAPGVAESGSPSRRSRARWPSRSHWNSSGRSAARSSERSRNSTVRVMPRPSCSRNSS